MNIVVLISVAAGFVSEEKRNLAFDGGCSRSYLEGLSINNGQLVNKSRLLVATALLFLSGLSERFSVSLFFSSSFCIVLVWLVVLGEPDL